MKNALFATTAIVAATVAGAAFADVSVSLGGNVVLKDNDAGTVFASDYDIGVAGSLTTDGGLTFGMSADAEDDGKATETVSISGGFGKVAIMTGDAAGSESVSGVSTGNFLEYDAVGGPGMTEGVLYTSPDFSGATVMLSFGLEDQNGGEAPFGVGVSYSIGGVALGLGFEDDGTTDFTGISLGYSAGIVGLAIAYEEDIIDASVTADVAGGTVGLMVSADDAAAETAYAVWYSMGLGGGATLYVEAGADATGQNEVAVGVDLSF